MKLRPKKVRMNEARIRRENALRLMGEMERVVEHGGWDGDIGSLADFMRVVGLPVPERCGQHCPTCRRELARK